MAASSKPHKRDRPPDTVKLAAALDAAMVAVFAFWDAVNVGRIKARSKRPPTQKRIESERSAVRGAIVARLLSNLRNLEGDYGKPGREWSESERVEAAQYITRFYELAREEVQRGRGRPKKTQPRGGLIESAMLPDAEQTKRASKEFRAMRPKLVDYVRGFKLGTYANEMNLKSVTKPQDVEQFVEKVHRGNEHVEQSVSTAKAARDALETYGLPPSFAKALEQHLSRLKKK